MGSQSLRRAWWLGGLALLLWGSWEIGSQLSQTPQPAFAQLPWQVSEQFNLTGGLNDGTDSSAIDFNEAADLQNVVLTTSGAVKKRNGFTQLDTTSVGASTAFTGLTQYTLTDGSRFLVASTSDNTTGRFYAMPYGSGINGPTGTWTDITPATGLAFSQNVQADFAVAQGKVVLEDGVGTTPPFVWDGVAAKATALAGSPPNATMVELHKNLLWLAGDSANPSRVTFSNIGDITTWTNTDFLSVNTNDGQQVRALKSALDCLYIFKDASIWRACGSDRDNITLEQMVTGYGTLSNQSVQLIGNIFYFLDQRGEVAAYDGGIHIQVISQNINGTLNTLNQARLGQAVSTAFNDGSGSDNYYLSVSQNGAGTNALMLQYNPALKAWLKHSGFSANAMTTYEIGSVQRAVLFGDYIGHIYRYPNSTSDNTQPIDSFYMSGQYHYGNAPHMKTFKLLRAFFNQAQIATQTVSIQTLVDFQQVTSGTVSVSTSGSLWDVAVWDTGIYGDFNTVIARVDLTPGFGDFFQWRVMDKSVNNPFSLRGIQVWYEPSDRIGGQQ